MHRMHTYDDETEELARAIVAYARNRIASPQPLDRVASADELARRAGRTITPDGIGWEEALRIWAEVLAPATISTDHPASVAFVPAAPTKASVLFDLIVGASSTIATGWIDGAGAIWAENEALRWVADLAGFPGEAGGVFVSGGSAGNLSALVTARHAASERRRRPAGPVAVRRQRHGALERGRGGARDGRRRPPGTARRAGPADRGGAPRFARRGRRRRHVRRRRDRGSDERGDGRRSGRRGGRLRRARLWLHVDGAYGGAGLLAPSVRPLFDGIERADSFIVDPHKWLFAPYDACALLYREPSVALRAHRQEASYLDTALATPDWNPATTRTT